ncbi:MAG: phospholipid/cholesterol/gamma-HCH transport system substrate-binding protein, partial [Solirubrobacteraceae bacterium]|nr:phospholipid/cholesterol/gamma-HCH transport system substrate-binding protein [Solirubrobacteraceae bacterium]
MMKRLPPFQAGLLAIVVIAIGCYLGFTKKIPFRSHFEIQAAFRSSNNLRPNSPVRIAGVEVGKVAKIEPTSPGASSAVVTMRINDLGRPIHADATAKIRPRIFLEGNFFVDLTAGSAAEPVLGDGDRIPSTQTSTPVQLDEVLKALDFDTRSNLQLTLGELGKAFDAGLAKAFDKSLPDQAPAFKFSAIVAEALLGRRPHDLSGVVRDFGTDAAALDRSPPRLKSLLENFNIFAHSLAIENDNLAATVGELPRTLAAATPALDSLNAAFPSVRRFAISALPGVRSSGPAVAALRPLVAQLDGLVSERELRGLSRDLRAATPGLVRLSTRSVPLWHQLRPLASCLNNTVLPWSQDTVPDAAFPETGPVYQSAVKWLPGLAGESRSFDANGPWFKVLGSGGVETVQLGNGLLGLPLFPVEGVNPPQPAARPPLQPGVPCETQ